MTNPILDGEILGSWNGTCPRCGAKDFCYSMSWFTTEDVCCTCKDEERHAPNYDAARAAELASVQRGDRHFAGIGLGAADAAALAAVRAQRPRLCRCGQPCAGRLLPTCGRATCRADHDYEVAARATVAHDKRQEGR
jgi:hypothetical protein